jgi:metal-sulfur cluster biosynthetic enzyme
MAEREQIVEMLKKIQDPEIGYDIWSLGLIYDIGIDDKKIKILMTFTTPMCPYGPQLVDEVRRNLSALDGVGEVEVEITFTPVWGPDKMSEDARMALGV